MRTLFSGLFLIVLCSFGAAQQPVSVDVVKASGKFSANVYKNAKLGISITMPEDWVVLDDKTNRETLQAGAKLVKQNQNKGVAKSVGESLIKSRILMQLTPDGGGAVISIGVEPIDPRITSFQYAVANANVLKSVPTATVTRNVYQKSLGGKVWSGYDAEFTIDGVKQKQQSFHIIQNGFALFIVTSISEKYFEFFEPDVAGSLASIKFVR